MMDNRDVSSSLKICLPSGTADLCFGFLFLKGVKSNTLEFWNNYWKILDFGDLLSMSVIYILGILARSMPVECLGDITSIISPLIKILHIIGRIFYLYIFPWRSTWLSYYSLESEFKFWLGCCGGTCIESECFYHYRGLEFGFHCAFVWEIDVDNIVFGGGGYY